jgi:hypothetical protein
MVQIIESTLAYNPPNRQRFLKGNLATLFLLLSGFLFSAITHWTITPIIIFTFIALVPFYIFWERDYLLRPLSIEIKEWGFIFNLRYRKNPKLISWHEVKWLSAPPGDPAKQKEYYQQDGYLSLGGNKIYSLYWPMAIAAREAYKEYVGSYPPIDASGR